ncbi:serine hydrolase domain-containing protein [Salipaludibacillus keqinensis]|uniref:serine hydrolase domain-containing protein n=1 Tax=Salipaludibacillus keqinensis TaxID=2045207 RepID=UPI001304F6AC|nr:serine hydrolase domain-containing protein [Salipaludibacillus keqinensis]
MNKIDKRCEELDILFDYLERNRLFSGVVLLSEDGKAFYKRAVGKLSTKRNSHNAIFEIASVSKSFTAMAVMMLIEDKKMTLEDEITTFFPSLPYAGITIKNLLNHTSGLPDYMEWFEEEENWDHNKIATNRDIIHFLVEQKPKLLFEVNEKWEYCNTGYVLLAEIIQLVSNIPYEDYLYKNIFTPLNMKNTSTHSQFLDSKLEKYVTGFIYDWEKDVYFLPNELEEHKYVYFFDGVKGDGGIKSTVDDLLIWEQSIYNNQLISNEAIESMLKPALVNGETTDYCPGLHRDYGAYGFGWKLENHPEYKGMVLHDGYWAGYSSVLISYKDYNKSLIMLNNLDFMNEKLKKVPHNLALALESVLFNKEVDLEEFKLLTK